jgi:hypothetical protein
MFTQLRFKIPALALMQFFVLWLCAPRAEAQFQSAFVFAADPKGVAVYTRNDATGVLTPISGSPFPSKEAVTFLALDFRGRYLFTANNATSKISMFSIDTNTGALQEAANSPFASGYTNAPMLLAPEITGQLLYVINYFGSSTIVSSLESFQIDSANQTLVPSGNAAVDLPGLYFGGAVHPSGKTFYGYFNTPSPSNPDAASFLVFNSSTGTFTTTSFPSGSPAQSFAMDPAGLHAVLASGSNSGEIFTYGLNADGTLSEFSTSALVSRQPGAMALDTLGQYLYVTLAGSGSEPSSVHLYSPTTLAELSNSPLPANFTTTATWLVDPSAPLVFADQVYQVSPADGLLTSLLGPNTLVPPAVFSQPPGSQPVEGPVAQLNATSFAFGSVAVSVASFAQTLTITNTGGQNLTIDTLAIGGANAADFSEQDTCHVPTVITPNQFCAATIAFTPSGTGARTASLVITDNAAPPSESVALSGTGVAQTSAVTLVPGSLAFGAASAPILEGSSVTSSVTVTNSGGLALHISNIALSGANSNEFSFSAPSCSTAIAASSNCTISVSFAPLAAGLRSASITLTDDAPDSPQTIQISGSAAAAFTFAAAAGASTSATVTAGQTATYNLQITPGTGFAGSISLSCSGAPAAATCNVPQSVMVLNGVPTAFAVTVSTTAATAGVPVDYLPRMAPPSLFWTGWLVVIFAMLLWRFVGDCHRNAGIHGRKWILNYSLATGILLAMTMSIAGCGGGSSGTSSAVVTVPPVPPVPPPAGTPAGTSTLVISATPAAQAGKQLAPQTVQLTLIVK